MGREAGLVVAPAAHAGHGRPERGGDAGARCLDQVFAVLRHRQGIQARPGDLGHGMEQDAEAGFGIARFVEAARPGREAPLQVGRQARQAVRRQGLHAQLFEQFEDQALDRIGRAVPAMQLRVGMQQAQGHAVGVGAQRRETFRPGLGRYLDAQVRRPGPQGPFAAVQEVAAEMQFAVAGQRPQRGGAGLFHLLLPRQAHCAAGGSIQDSSSSTSKQRW
jgi:hypothetical protein